jgi:hypothetical protein
MRLKSPRLVLVAVIGLKRRVRHDLVRAGHRLHGSRLRARPPRDREARCWVRLVRDLRNAPRLAEPEHPDAGAGAMRQLIPRSCLERRATEIKMDFDRSHWSSQGDRVRGHHPGTTKFGSDRGDKPRALADDAVIVCGNEARRAVVPAKGSAESAGAFERVQWPLAEHSDGGRARVHAELGVDVFEVPTHGPRRYRESLSDLRIGSALGDEIQDLPLARRQSGQSPLLLEEQCAVHELDPEVAAANINPKRLTGCSAPPLPQPRRQRSGKLRSRLTEVALEELACCAARKFDAAVVFKKYYGRSSRLVQRKCCSETRSGLSRAEKLHEVEVQGVDDGTVACREITPEAVETELRDPVWRSDSEPKIKTVLDTERPEQEVVRRRAAELAPAHDVGDPRCGKARQNLSAYRAFRLHDGHDRHKVETVIEPLVPRTHEVEYGAAVRAGAIGVANPIGRYEPTKLREELPGEWVVAAEALRLGDKAEQPLRIATRERRHGSPKIRRTSHGLKRAERRVLKSKEDLQGGGFE